MLTKRLTHSSVLVLLFIAISIALFTTTQLNADRPQELTTSTAKILNSPAALVAQNEGNRRESNRREGNRQERTLQPATLEPPVSTVAPPESNQSANDAASSQELDTILENGFVIDHHSVALFEQIPDSYVTAARDLPMLFSDRSVGQNINEALDCLTASSWESAPAACRRDYDSNGEVKVYQLEDLNNGTVPARILFDPDPSKYNRSNWTFEPKSGGWPELTQDFIEVLAPAYIGSKEVLSYQFSYLNVNEGSNIADVDSGFFADNSNHYDIHDLEAYMAQHPDKTFILWTTSLARSIGTQEATDFNNMMRQYAAEHDMILFDMADITSHTDQGTPCYDNVNDGQDFPAICPDYTTEAVGGHLGSVSGGKIRMAKTFWVLMARVTGWDGAGTSQPTNTPAVTGTGTPIPTETPVLTATTTVTGTPPTNTPTATPRRTPRMTPTGTPAANSELFIPSVGT